MCCVPSVSCLLCAHLVPQRFYAQCSQTCHSQFHFLSVRCLGCLRNLEHPAIPDKTSNRNYEITHYTRDTSRTTEPITILKVDPSRPMAIESTDFIPITDGSPGNKNIDVLNYDQSGLRTVRNFCSGVYSWWPCCSFIAWCTFLHRLLAKLVLGHDHKPCGT